MPKWEKGQEMTEKIKLLPLTYEEVEALKMTLGALIAAKVDMHCTDDSMAKTLWGVILPQLSKINEKLNE